MSRLATRLGLISLWLGIDSVLLSLVSLFSFRGGWLFLSAIIIAIFLIVGSGIVLGRLLKWGWPITADE